MSQMYKYNIDVHGISQAEVEKVIDAIPFEICDYCYLEKTGVLSAYGEESMIACEDEDKHNEVKAGLNEAGIKFSRVETRWRCTECDEWDSEISSG